MSYCQGLQYIQENIRTEFISKYYNNVLVSYFIIKKIFKLIAKKYY